jgi:hypothetical protein
MPCRDELRRDSFSWFLREKALRRLTYGAFLYLNASYEKVEASIKNPLKEDIMSKTSSGVYQLPNGMWGFRYAFWFNGKQKDIKRITDKNGNPFKTKTAAIKARETAMIEAHAELIQPTKKKQITVAEVYAEYCENGRCGKAYGTTRKQDSLWNNHISKEFGNRYVDDISVAEVVDYLKGATLTTKKSVQYKAIIQKHSKDFGGSLEDPDVIKLCGCSRNSYYKYKKEMKSKNNS